MSYEYNRLTDLQTDRATARGPSGPNNIIPHWINANYTWGTLNYTTGQCTAVVTLALKHYQAKKNGPLMGQVFLDLSDPGGGRMGWPNLRKWEKS